jgi:hypothetical protein
MQDIDGKEDTELTEEDLRLSWRSSSVEPVGQCRSIGNEMLYSFSVIV